MKKSLHILAFFMALIFLAVGFTDASDAKSKSQVRKAALKKSAKVKKNAPREDASENEIWMKMAKESKLLTGKASWYGKDFHNKKTASGVNYDMFTFTAAHKTLPLGTVVKVTDQANGKSVIVCVNDRGPYARGRIIDLSYAAAKQLNLESKGVSKVAVEVISDESGRLLSKDKAYFVQYGSGNAKTRLGPFAVFADAAVMREAVTQAHPGAEVVLENLNGK